MFPSHKNQSIDLQCKSNDWFLCDGSIACWWVGTTIQRLAEMFFFIIVKRFSLDEIPEIWMLITLSWLMMIVGQAPPLSTSLALIGRHFFHIMFQNLMRGPAALRSLNFPCVPASKLQSHWSWSWQSALLGFSSISCVFCMVTEVRFGGACPDNHHPSNRSHG